jgi:hypothetical protein
MKSTKLLVAVLAAGLAMPALPSSACSNASIKGSYGFILTGVNSSSTLAAIVGEITADGKGGLTGSETISNDGVISSSVAVTGSYSMKSNCNGTASITPTGFPTANYRLTIASAATQIDMVDTDSGTTEFGYALAVGKISCTLATLKGTFGYQGGGFSSSIVPVAFAGQSKGDGAGNFKGTETVSGGGQIFSGPISGKYTVNSDCTGSGSFMFDGQQTHSDFVIVNGGKMGLQIQTDSGAIVTSTVTRQ